MRNLRFAKPAESLATTAPLFAGVLDDGQQDGGDHGGDDGGGDHGRFPEHNPGLLSGLTAAYKARGGRVYASLSGMSLPTDTLSTQEGDWRIDELAREAWQDFFSEESDEASLRRQDSEPTPPLPPVII